MKYLLAFVLFFVSASTLGYALTQHSAHLIPATSDPDHPLSVNSIRASGVSIALALLSGLVLVANVRKRSIRI